VAIGEAWERGKLRIATEHFASSFVRGRLLGIFQSLPNPRSSPRVVVGCAPHEMHEIGVLMLAVLLRREGFRVEYLGPDLHLEDLLAYARVERPAVICLSANSEESARALARVQPALNRMRPRPRFAFGGLAFNVWPRLRAAVPGHFLGETATAAAVALRRLLAN
jgi:methanogenic corrinoid protein MtbC1